MKNRYTEKDIQKWIYSLNNNGTFLPNIYVGENEVDTLHISTGNICTFYEVKLSRQDFFHDMEKQRHRILMDAEYDKMPIKPYKFYYVTYGFELFHDEIPEYAGWYRISDIDRIENVETKRAPVLCKERATEDILFDIYKKASKRYSRLYHSDGCYCGGTK